MCCPGASLAGFEGPLLPFSHLSFILLPQSRLSSRPTQQACFPALGQTKICIEGRGQRQKWNLSLTLSFSCPQPSFSPLFLTRSGEGLGSCILTTMSLSWGPLVPRLTHTAPACILVCGLGRGLGPWFGLWQLSGLQLNGSPIAVGSIAGRHEAGGRRHCGKVTHCLELSVQL